MILQIIAQEIVKFQTIQKIAILVFKYMRQEINYKLSNQDHKIY